MSSTPSISRIRVSCSPGLAGAKPTPQLPAITVVAPRVEEGVIRSSQVIWPS
jgi:hypothetical protein